MVAIIFQQEFRRSGQVLLGGAGVRRLQLFLRKRDAGDVGAGHFRKIQTKPAPARADVEHAVAAGDQQLRSKMPLLGQLGVVERRIRGLEIGAAVLLVGVEEQRIEPAIEIVMARDIGFRPRGRIELLGVPDEIAQPPLQPRPARQQVGLIEQDGQRVGNRGVLDHERAFHVDFAERKLGIEQNPPLGVGVRNRTATGLPVPSPQVNFAPLAVVKIIVPRRMN